jgi:hypothetical protein
MLNINKKNKKKMFVRQASLQGNLLAREPDSVVPGKRTVLSVEPWGEYRGRSIQTGRWRQVRIPITQTYRLLLLPVCAHVDPTLPHCLS